MDGVVLAPSAFSITRAFFPSITATHEFVVPRSMPITSPPLAYPLAKDGAAALNHLASVAATTESLTAHLCEENENPHARRPIVSHSLALARRRVVSRAPRLPRPRASLFRRPGPSLVLHLPPSSSRIARARIERITPSHRVRTRTPTVARVADDAVVRNNRRIILAKSVDVDRNQSVDDGSRIGRREGFDRSAPRESFVRSFARSLARARWSALALASRASSSDAPTRLRARCGRGTSLGTIY